MMKNDENKINKFKKNICSIFNECFRLSSVIEVQEIFWENKRFLRYDFNVHNIHLYMIVYAVYIQIVQ